MNITLKPEFRHLLRAAWTELGPGDRGYVSVVLDDAQDELPQAGQYRLVMQYLTTIENRRRDGWFDGWERSLYVFEEREREPNPERYAEHLMRWAGQLDTWIGRRRIAQQLPQIFPKHLSERIRS